jgi:hypothetical protein
MVRQCINCLKKYEASSRHKACPSCRKSLSKRKCPDCGELMQRKSKKCRKCYLESKQYPNSRVKHLSKDGYFYVYYRKHPHCDREGRVYEHRIIMEKKIGRYLLPFENVHHKNGIKTDNSIDNLELWVSVQPAGGRVVDVVKWARKILVLYGDVSSVG